MASIAVSYTCLRDLELLKALNAQLTEWGMEHWAFFEEREMMGAYWSPYKGKVYERANGGDNGMGRDGAYAKINMLKKAYLLADSLNLLPCTFIDMDSDVRFNRNILSEFECESKEFKGFSGYNMSSHEPEEPNRRTGEKWYYATGCIKSFHSDFIKWMMEVKDWDNHFSTLISHSITPSEDAMLSYLAQVPYQGKFINMKERFKLSVQAKDYGNTNFDIIS